MIFLMMITFAQASEASLLIQDGNFGMHVYSWKGEYTIHVQSRGNFTRYSYPIEATVHLAYDGDFTMNNHEVNIVNKSGTITPPILVQQLFSPSNDCKCNDSCTINMAVPPPVQLCYNFSTERITLKAVASVLALLVLLSNGTKISTTLNALGRDLQQSKFTRRFSRTRSTVAGSETSYTTVKKESSV